MVKVAIAGGLGDLGQAITAALQATGRHELFILSRSSTSSSPAQASHPKLDLNSDNITILSADYTSIPSLTSLLAEHEIHTIICTLNMSSEPTSTAQTNLIQAALSPHCPSVRRFIPSEFNVDYDLPDAVLPYPAKHFHRAARRLLESQTKLEFAYFYFGSFMEYIGLPRLRTHLHPLYLVFDFAHFQAAVPVQDPARLATIVMTRTDDGARYVAAALDLAEGTWPNGTGAFAVVGSSCTPTEVVRMAETSMGRQVTVRYDHVRDLRDRTGDAGLLPGTLEQLDPARADQKLRGRDRAALQDVLCNLAAGIGMGAFDLLGRNEKSTHRKHDVIDIVELLGEKVKQPMRIDEFLRRCWGSDVPDGTGTVVLD